MNEVLVLPATELARRIRARETSSRAVVSAHIDHARGVGPALNAIVAERYEEALNEADAVDARLAREDRSELPPLLGVPCTVKECFALRGMPQTAGLVARKGIVAREDATAVARLRAAGAIPIGVTNTSELCMWLESDNRVYGRTNNPYDVRCMVGGSSGGEGAIVASGASPFGLGSDIGGSIRLPAFFNGVFGHKPTGGLVPGSGQYPLPADGARRYVTTGPIARRATDLMLLLRLLAGPDGLDAGCEAMPLGDPESVAVSSLEVLHVAEDGRTPVSDELRAAQERAADHFRRIGARVRTTRIPELTYSVEIWSAMLAAAGGPSFADLLMNHARPFSALRSLAELLVGRSPHTIPALGLAVVEKIPKALPGLARRALEHAKALRAALDARLGPTTVMLYPSFWRTAPRHFHAVLTPMRFGYTAVLNVMEVPSTQVPMGLSTNGLPTGLQVVAGRGHDHVAIACALELERAFGGWVPPPTLC